MHKQLALLLAPVLLAGCAVGPDYRAPAPLPPAKIDFVTATPAADGAAALSDQWWRLYNDPVLDDLIARAFAANTDLRVAAANLARARATVSEAAVGRLPDLELSGGANYGNGMQNGFNQAGGSKQWSYTGGAAISWEADLFGRIGRSVEAARADAQSVEATMNGVRVVVAAETARSYTNACSLAQSIAIARESQEIADRTVKLVQTQEQAGSASRLDVERAAAAAATAQADVAPLEAQRRVALFELAALLGETPSGVPEAASSCAVAPAPLAALPIGDGATLLRRRPDLREAERTLAADTARIGIATADLYPRISLGANGNFFRNDSVRGNDSFTFSLGPLISWSFGNAALARTRIRQAEAQTQASLASFDGRVIGALKEVEQTLSLYDAETRRRDSLQRAQDRAIAAYRLAEARYRAGSVSFLDALVAQNEAVTARAALATSTQQLASRRVDLFKALGGGWETPAKATSQPR